MTTEHQSIHPANWSSEPIMKDKADSHVAGDQIRSESGL